MSDATSVSPAASPYVSSLPPGDDGFGHLLRAEWTKFRTVRGWLIGMLAASAVIVLLGLTSAAGSTTSCSNGPVEVPCPAPVIGPGGEAVNDKLYLVHRPLTGDGSITVRVGRLSGEITYPPPDFDKIVPGVVPWAKAGIIVKEGTTQGSPYAALMITGGHGVRMQYDYVHDLAARGDPAPDGPRWLRLTRVGDELTGAESVDGVSWTTVGSARLDGLPATVRIGMFVTSPCDLSVQQNDLGGSIGQCRFTQLHAVFDHVGVQGSVPAGDWARDDVGADPGHHPGNVQQTADGFTLTGSGDVGPQGAEGPTSENTLVGTLAALVLVIVVAVATITVEYRRGLIRTTLLAGPRRGRLLPAKALVVGVAGLVAGLVGAGVAMPLGLAVLRAGGNQPVPATLVTQLRLVLGVGLLLGLTAVLALALGSLLRRSVPAVAAAIGLVVLPYLLATASVLSADAARWLLRLTPAAGFAILQSVPAYPQVIANYAPSAGYYPLPPWGGLAVLCGAAALALGLAVRRLRRGDA